MSKYFGTNGIRGLFHELSPQLALKAAQAFGIWTNERSKFRVQGSETQSSGRKTAKVLVARDARLTGECLSAAVRSGLASVGCEVIDLGVCSAPGAEFMLRKEGAEGLIIVTASHNPPEWNALKFVDWEGVTVSKERGEGIEALMGKIGLAKWDEVKPARRIENAVAEHIKAIEGSVDLEKIRKAKLSIALDFGNGTGSLYSEMFRRVAKISAINENMDGHFPGRDSEPTEQNIQELASLVKKGGFDAGFAWDGDADRFVMLDEKGDFVIGDKVFALSVLHRLRGRNGGKIATTVSTSRAAEDVAKMHGAETIYTKVGAPYLSEAMAKEGADIAGEEVGGVIWKEISLAKDGPATAMKMLELIAEKPLGEWVSGLPQYFNAKTKIAVSREKKKEIIEKFASSQKGKGVVAIDGVRVNFPDSWVIVRASGTEDYIRVFAEAKTKEKAEKLVKEYEERVKKL